MNLVLKNLTTSFFTLFVIFYLNLKNFGVTGHGRLLEPPSRSSMWRFKEFSKYNPLPNYNDNELWCGGLEKQFKRNGGRCGPCGDAFDEVKPRDNEYGGKYGRGVTVRDYVKGQVLPVRIQLTVSHKGYFQFRICDLINSIDGEVQQCFNQNLLQHVDGSGDRYYIQTARKLEEFYDISLQLPKNLTCSRCVLQWHYRTGNTWGKCGDGTMALGCGPQEVFRGCADISISP